MKRTVKVLTFLLALAMMLALSACSLEGLFSPRVQIDSTPVTLVLNGGSGVSKKDFVSGSEIVEPESQPTKSGYSFTGWYSDKNCTKEFVFPVTIEEGETYTIYAGWTEKTPEATFVFGAGIADKKAEAADGVFTPPTVERAGYELTGWYTDSGLTNVADFTAKAVDGATFYAGWTAIEYTLSYDYSGLGSAREGTVTTFTVEDEVVLLAPDSVTSGYEFLYWSDEEGRVAKIERGTVGDISLTAVYLSHNNYVEAVAGGKIDGTELTVAVRYATEAIAPYDILTVSDRAQVAVKRNGTLLPEGNVALEVGENEFAVVVTSENAEERTYRLTVTRYPDGSAIVTFHYPDESTFAVPVTKGEEAEEPTPKSFAGKEFFAWYKESGFVHLYDFSDAVADDFDLYAKYDLIPYDIVYHYGIGSAPDVQINTYDVDHRADMLDAVPPTGYAFSKYVDEEGNEVPFIPAGSRTGEVDLYAHYARTGTTVLTADFVAEDQPLTLEEVSAFINWAVAYRYTTVSFELTDGTTAGELHDALNLSGVTALNSSVSMHTDNYSYNSITNEVTSSVTVHFEYVEPSGAISDEDYYTQLGYNVHTEYVPTRGDDYERFAINSIESTVTVRNSDQLAYATMLGYRPAPVAGSPAEEMYAAAKAALRDCVDDTMTEVEKAHAIYHWLLKNVVYDRVLYLNEKGYTVEQLKTYNGFYLEGVFTDHRAVCDGISKAFALMCNIEGIPCVQVSGNMVGGGGHAWNKVCLGGKWFVVDATHGDTHVNDEEVVNHGFFMITDEVRAETAIPDDYTELVANTSFDVYGAITFVADEKTYDFVVESRQELSVMITFFAEICAESEETQTIDFRINYDFDKISTELSNANGGFDYGKYGLSYLGGEEKGDVVILIAYKK